MGSFPETYIDPRILKVVRLFTVGFSGASNQMFVVSDNHYFQVV